MIAWRCMSMGGDDCGEIHTLDCMIRSMRDLRDVSTPEEWQKIRAEYHAVGCYYCVGEEPGCGLVLIRPLAAAR